MRENLTERTALTRRHNRLIHEKSPYLLQHARNPVDWRSWGEEAFEEARRADKPVFLSIGYSTCHWCHVMGRESFEDEAVARVLNRAFIPIKVDREERPDVDAVYMEACQTLTGSGGWPLSVLTTPDQQPFWAGTYLPPRSRYGQLGLVELLEEVERLWRTDRQRLLEVGKQITDRVSRAAEAGAGTQPRRELLRSAADQLRRGYDRQNGGFGGAPKFPTPHNLLFLMAYGEREGDASAMEMAETTLTQMARGGIFDHIGGGFCRYSTDQRWLTPHFEKMLYDNALLAWAYLEAFDRTGGEFYRETACRTLDYALKELRLPGGGFACGQDADSGGEEGGFYLITAGEADKVLGETEGGSFRRWYGITEKGNFQGKNIPNLLENPDYSWAYPGLAAQREKMAAYRRERMGLHRDDKVLTSWNGLMIAALARAAQTLDRADYLRAAESARLFLKTRLTTPEGRLYLRWREREAAVEGQLDDYAFYVLGLLELYGANYAVSCLREAVKLTDKMVELFWDEAQGGFYRTAHDGERLIARQKETYDGALPSGNAAAAWALARLAGLTGRRRYGNLARRQIAFLAGNMGEYPMGRCFGLLAMMEELYPSRELVCAAAEGVPAWLAGLSRRYGLRTVVKTWDNSRALERLAPYTAAYPIPASGETLYLCRGGRCAAPAEGREALERMLREELPV